MIRYDFEMLHAAETGIERGAEFEVKLHRLVLPDWVREHFTEAEQLAAMEARIEMVKNDFELSARDTAPWIERIVYVGNAGKRGGWLVIEAPKRKKIAPAWIALAKFIDFRFEQLQAQLSSDAFWRATLQDKRVELLVQGVEKWTREELVQYARDMYREDLLKMSPVQFAREWLEAQEEESKR